MGIHQSGQYARSLKVDTACGGTVPGGSFGVTADKNDFTTPDGHRLRIRKPGGLVGSRCRNSPVGVWVWPIEAIDPRISENQVGGLRRFRCRVPAAGG